MRIAIVAADFSPGRTGGIETYFRNLVAALGGVDRSNEYTVFVPEAEVPALQPAASNFRTMPIRARASRARSGALRLLGRRPPGGVVPDAGALAAIERGGFDVVHFPLQSINPWGVRGRTIVTFVDIQHEYWPQFFAPRTLRARRAGYRPTAEAAQHLIAISEYTKQTLIEKYAIRPDRISVVHLSFDRAHFGSAAAAEHDLRLPDRYFFYPAATWPHKNHARLLEAFARVSRAHPEFALVLTGMAMQEQPRVEALIARMGLHGAVRMLGYVPYRQLPALYRRAYALVFPSLFEGFGIPLCEAMASGCPIVASRTTSIPEVVGDAALLFDPLDPEDIASQMTRLIVDPAERDRLTAAGRARVGRFTPDAMARATVAVYERVGAR